MRLKGPRISITQDAWFGIDSRHGRYMFGAKESPVDGLVPAEQTVNIVESGHLPFKGERFFVRRACASDFLIRNVFIGANYAGPVIGITQPIIAEPFAVDFDQLFKIDLDAFDGKTVLKIVIDKSAAELLGQPFPLPTLMPGMQIAFEVENISDKPSRFLGAFLGKCQDFR